MVCRSDNHKKRYIDHPSDKLQLACMIHGPGHFTKKCKLLNQFGTNYYLNRPFKKGRFEPIADKKYKKNQEVNSIVYNAVDDILK